MVKQVKTSKQMRSGVDTKSGQEVAKHGFGKTDVRYWHDAIFKTKYTRFGHALEIEDWSVRIQWRGRRETFNLKTPNKAAAAAKAKEIYSILVGSGWDAIPTKRARTRSVFPKNRSGFPRIAELGLSSESCVVPAFTDGTCAP